MEEQRTTKSKVHRGSITFDRAKYTDTFTFPPLPLDRVRVTDNGFVLRAKLYSKAVEDRKGQLVGMHEQALDKLLLRDHLARTNCDLVKPSNGGVMAYVTWKVWVEMVMTPPEAEAVLCTAL